MKEHEKPEWQQKEHEKSEYQREYKKGYRTGARQDPGNPWDPKDYTEETGEKFHPEYHRGYNNALENMKKK
jgi:hypothetical protein